MNMQTERIELLPPSLDLVAQTRIAIKESEAELSEYLGWVSSSLANPHENMQVAIDNFNAFENEIRYHILEKSSASIIGTTGLLVRDVEVPFYEIGYWVRSSHAGKGFIAEAVSLLEQYTFTELGANRIEIRAAACNTKSRAVAQRAGYTLEAELINERRLPSGKLANTVVYAKTSLQENTS